MEELLVLVKDLKKTIDQQNKSIHEAQTELKEIKEVQQHVNEQINELKDEICMLQDQVLVSYIVAPVHRRSEFSARAYGRRR